MAYESTVFKNLLCRWCGACACEYMYVCMQVCVQEVRAWWRVFPQRSPPCFRDRVSNLWLICLAMLASSKLLGTACLHPFLMLGWWMPTSKLVVWTRVFMLAWEALYWAIAQAPQTWLFLPLKEFLGLKRYLWCTSLRICEAHKAIWCCECFYPLHFFPVWLVSLFWYLWQHCV